MTSSERKIINFLGETKEKTNVRLIAQKTNLSSDYARLLCRALARSGHIKFENDLCHLLKRGRSRFENNDPAIEEPVAVFANATLLTDESVVASPASDRNDEEENQEEDVSEDKDEDKSASTDEELDKVLADLEPSAKKVENEGADKPDLPVEASAEAGELEKEVEVAEEPKIESDAGKEEVRSEADIEEEKPPTPSLETESQIMAKSAEIEEEKKPESQETVKIEAGPADSSASVASSENSEKAAPKEEPAKLASSFGLSFKKVVNWFTEKK